MYVCMYIRWDMQNKQLFLYIAWGIKNVEYKLVMKFLNNFKRENIFMLYLLKHSTFILKIPLNFITVILEYQEICQLQEINFEKTPGPIIVED